MKRKNLNFLRCQRMTEEGVLDLVHNVANSLQHLQVLFLDFSGYKRILF